MPDTIVVLVTCASRAEAGRLARVLVEKRLAACVNVSGVPVHSVYRWKGKVETAREWLLIVKSTKRRFAALRQEIARLHSYEVPEVIALTIAAGSAAYLGWLEESVRPVHKEKSRRKR